MHLVQSTYFLIKAHSRKILWFIILKYASAQDLYVLFICLWLHLVLWNVCETSYFLTSLFFLS